MSAVTVHREYSPAALPANVKPHPKPKTISIALNLPMTDYAPFVAAAGILERTMKGKAPDAPGLCLFMLTRRDAKGIAEDFLESIVWPLTARTGASSVSRRSRDQVQRERKGLPWRPVRSPRHSAR